MFGQIAQAESSPAKLSYLFSSQWRKNSGELKIFPPPEAKGSLMPLARAE